MRDIDEKVAATVTTGGRITIPKPLREALGWKPGCKLDMSIDTTGTVVVTEVTSSPARQKAVAEAIDRILLRRQRLHLDRLTIHLDRLTIRCLIDEGRER